jgi:hypothetical protein
MPKPSDRVAAWLRSGAMLMLAPALTLGAACSPPGLNDTDPTDGAQVAPDTPVPSRGHHSEETPPDHPEDADAVVVAVPSSQWQRMVKAGMWRPGCPATRSDLRRVEVNHHRFDGTVTRGVLVVNRDVAQTVAEIFTRLYDAGFPIRRMVPVERYDGDANASLSADNTSAYNCRRPDQINAPPLASPHANGRAIDINPRENPWRDLRCDCWFPTSRTAPREPGPGVILKGGLVWRLFTREDWVWQNIDVPDYMHFDTGYPSRPYQPPQRADDAVAATDQ